MSNKKNVKVEETVENVVVEPVENVAIEPVIEPSAEEKVVYGIVTLNPKYNKLNIRDKASKAGKVVDTINAKAEVIIDETKSTNKWYNICTKGGVEGFCMKEFITIK